MKKKTYKIFGVGLVVMLIASMLVFTIPVSAAEEYAPKANTWTHYVRAQGAAGGWFYDPAIEIVGPIAKDKDGEVLYAYVEGAPAPARPEGDIFISNNGGRSWTTSDKPGAYSGGRVVDMVCSSLYAETLYVTDGNYVYKSEDGAMNFSIVAKENLEYTLMGDCGITVVDEPITSIDVGYNGAEEPIVFIGTKNVGHYYPQGHALEFQAIVGSVYWIAEATYPAEWADLQLFCYGCCDAMPLTANITGEVIGVGDTVTVTFSGTLANFPVKPTSVVVTDGTETFTDNGDGTLTGDLGGTGTIDYDTGVGSVTFNTAPGAVNITADYTYFYDGGCGCFDVYAVGADPNFADTNKVYAAITTDDLDCDCNLTTDDPSTQVVYSKGTTCAWTQVGELWWNCDPSNPFEIRHASRFAFPSDFADTGTMFIGVAGIIDDNGTPLDPTDDFSLGGDVYRVTDRPGQIVIDLNVRGFNTGCQGLLHANICSLDIKGSTDDASLIAGSYDRFEDQFELPGQLESTEVYYSSDGGWTWADSKKDPTGIDRTYVLWYKDSAVASARWCDCGFSMSCGDEVGEYWNQISLINTCFDCRLDLSHAPGYVDSTSYMYVLMVCEDSCLYSNPNLDCDCDDSTSLLRWDGSNWERVYSSFTYDSDAGDALMDWVEVSPDFNTTSAVYLMSDDFQVYRSMDAGCSWSALSYPCEPRPTVNAWIVVDEETVLVAGDEPGPFTEIIYKTTRHGTRPWDEFPIDSCDGVDFDLSPNIGNDGQVLFGDGCGTVYISEDTGSTWEKVAAEPACNVLDSANTYVQFDPGYGTSGDPGENMIYAAAGHIIARCDIDTEAPWAGQCWAKIKDDVCNASGIDANGDTALYVSDAGAAGGVESPITVTGTIEVKCAEAYFDWWSGDLELTAKEVTPISGTFNDGELVSIIEYNLICEFLSWELVDEADCMYMCEGQITGAIGIQGVDSGATGKITISPDQYGDTVEGYFCSCCMEQTEPFDPAPIGGFEGGLYGWTVDGWGDSAEALTSAAFTPAISPTEGTSMALVSNGPDTLNPAYNADIDGNGVDDNDMSTLSTCFTIDEPHLLTFDWGWLTGEETWGGDFYDDFFQVILDGNVILAGSVYGIFTSPYPDVDCLIGAPTAVTSAGPTNGCYFDDGFSGWYTFTGITLTPGTHFLEFLVADQGNHSVDSGLLIDNVCLDGAILMPDGCECPGYIPDVTAIEVVSSFLTIDVPGAPLAACATGVWRTLNPLDMIPAGVSFSNVIEFELLSKGLEGDSYLWHPMGSDDLWLTTKGSSNILWVLDQGNCDYVWVWEDPLANPVILQSPACGGAQLVSTGSVTLSWQALDDATEYEIELYQFCPQCPEERLPITVENSKDTCTIVEGLAPGTEHFWRVRVAAGAPYLSKWSQLCSFTTALGAIPSLCSPVCGSTQNTLSPGFSWDSVPGAASYEVQIVVASEDGTADFTGATTLTTDVNALAAAPALEYSTTYFWRVRAVTAGVPGAWSVCVFSTMDEPVEPVPPADLIVNIPAEEVITPTWMWVLIGIGAALTIAVIILIVTTRRVP